MKALKLHLTGEITPCELNEENFEYKFQAMQKAIDCDCIDIVHAAKLPDPYCLVVDDEALLKDKPVINLYASYLYGFLEHGQPICGEVIIMKDKHTPDGIDTIGLEPEDFAQIMDLIVNPETVKGIKETLDGVMKLVEGNENETV